MIAVNAHLSVALVVVYHKRTAVYRDLLVVATQTVALCIGIGK